MRQGIIQWNDLHKVLDRKQLELDIHVTLTQALMAGKGYGDPEVVAALERAHRLVTETTSVGTPVHFSVLYALWASTLNSGAVAAALDHATTFLSSAQSQPSPAPLLIDARIAAF